MGKGIGGHHSHRMASDDWITPKYLIEALGPFDLDPCASATQPWPTAATHYTKADDGLSLPWKGSIWLNPPYGDNIGDWMGKMATHNNGIALIFARVETRSFFEHVWSRASGLLFLSGRLTFYRADGVISTHNSGGPSVLISYGVECRVRLMNVTNKLGGVFIPYWCVAESSLEKIALKSSEGRKGTKTPTRTCSSILGSKNRL